LPPTIAGQEFIESRRKTGTGYRLGGGIGYAAGPHISFHANYLHVFGTRMSFIPNRDLLPVFPVGTIASQLFSDNVIEPQRDEVTIGVRFRF
jgi:opacity protein-like surface antigen